MKLVRKIFRLALILVIATTILLFSASLLMQDKVADIILKSLNNSISTKFSYRSLKLSFLRRFPKASLELRDVYVHSSENFNKTSFTGINTDTLFQASNVSVEFRLTDIIGGDYNIESISSRNGRLNLYADSTGGVNWDISEKSRETGKNVVTIDLQKIIVHNIKASYNNCGIKLLISGNINNGRLKSRIHGDNIDFTSLADIDINIFSLDDTYISGTLNADLDLKLQSNKDGVVFKEGTLSSDGYDFGISGSVMDGNILDLNITGNNIDISKIRNFLPEKLLLKIKDYDPSGILIAACQIKGPMNRTSNPHVEMNYTLKRGRIHYKDSPVAIKDLSFEGSLSNGSKNNYETSSFQLNKVRLKLGSSEYTGSFSLSGFTHPVTSLSIKGRVFPGELKEFFNIKNLSSAEGSADIDLSLTTGFWPKETIKTADIVTLKPQADIVFNSLNIGFRDDKLLFNNINGEVIFSDRIRANNLDLVFRGQKIKINGQFENLPEWLSGMPVKMTAIANVSADRLIPETFWGSSTTETAQIRKKPVKLPGDIILDINFHIGSLDYKTFSSSDISGVLTYKPRLFTFKSVNLKALNGSVSGSGFIVQDISKSLITRGNFIIHDIDINKAFTTFHNFGQNFIKAENLAGTLSGSLSLMLPLDSLLTPQIHLLTAEGKYTIVKGALLNFDPIKKLSSFIELSELENIHFEQLQNDFFIKNYSLYMPQMDVKSSAADLSINGNHDFDNNYEYHVKVLLSEILSKKRKKKKSLATEFGLVEDDGLGRTSLLLKVENKGEDIKVGYDLKAAGNEIKKNIKTERQNLKSILNQEYGWYKTDTTVKAKPVEKKTKFRIKWDDTDTTYTVPDTVNKKKKYFCP